MEEHLVQIVAELKGIHSALEGIMCLGAAGVVVFVVAVLANAFGPTVHIHKEERSEPFEKFGPQ